MGYFNGAGRGFPLALALPHFFTFNLGSTRLDRDGFVQLSLCLNHSTVSGSFSIYIHSLLGSFVYPQSSFCLGSPLFSYSIYSISLRLFRLDSTPLLRAPFMRQNVIITRLVPHSAAPLVFGPIWVSPGRDHG